MSPSLIRITGLLAMISAAMAAPVLPTGDAPSFYEAGNNTDGFYGMSGSGLPTGTGRRHRQHKTKTQTVHFNTQPLDQQSTQPPSAQATSVLAAAEGGAGSDTTICTTDTITVTTTNKITVTVAPSPVAEGASSAPAAPVSGLQSRSDTNEAPSSSVKVEEVRVKPSYVAPAAPASSAAAPVEQPSSAVNPPASSPSAAAAPSSSSSYGSGSGSSSGGTKRGLAYNDPKMCTAFAGKKVSWAYNWGSTSSGLSGFEYVPQLWGTGPDKVKVWESDAKGAIAAGSTHLLGFNEPDHPDQANLSPSDAAAGYKKYLSDMFGGSNVKLGSPAVTNGGGSMGLTYLKTFMDQCKGCQIDFVVVHWYDSASNVQYFKDHITKAHEQSGKPVWITEFGASGSDDQVNGFLQQVLPWLDSQDFVERYSYFMAKDGLMNKGSGLSGYGNTFATA